MLCHYAHGPMQLYIELNCTYSYLPSSLYSTTTYLVNLLHFLTSLRPLDHPFANNFLFVKLSSILSNVFSL